MSQDQNNDINQNDAPAPRTKADPNFQARREARAARFEELAEKNKEHAEARFTAGSKMADQIPLGQPILVGHHSEKADRRFRNRIHGHFTKGNELQKKSEFYASKASSAESNNSIMSDDPDAMGKLDAKIRRLETRRDFMKAINKAWRKAGKPAADDATGWDKVAQDPAVGLTPSDLVDVRASFANAAWFKNPYPAYAFQNLSANIARLKERRAAMAATEARAAIAFEINGVDVREEDGRINVRFPSIPTEEIRRRLKSHPLSLKWSRYSGCWVRKVTQSTGAYFVQALKDVCNDYPGA